MNDPSHVRSGPSTEVPGPPAAKMAARPPVLSATSSGHWHFRAAKWTRSPGRRREPRSESGWGWRPPAPGGGTPTRPAGAVTCQHARERAPPRAPPPPGAESESRAPAGGGRASASGNFEVIKAARACQCNDASASGRALLS